MALNRLPELDTRFLRKHSDPDPEQIEKIVPTIKTDNSAVILRLQNTVQQLENEIKKLEITINNLKNHTY